jgi:hypothetical protein
VFNCRQPLRVKLGAVLPIFGFDRKLLLRRGWRAPQLGSFVGQRLM